MPNNILFNAKNILNSVNNIESCKQQINNLQKVGKLNSEQKKKVDELKFKIKQLLISIEKENSNIFNSINGKLDLPKPSEKVDSKSKLVTKIPVPLATLPKPQIVMPQSRNTPEYFKSGDVIKPDFSSASFKLLTKQEKAGYIKELNINYDELERFVKEHKDVKKIKIKELKKETYSIYKPNPLGEFSNKYMKVNADKLIKKYPKLFQPMFDKFLTVEMELLSRSYVSMIILFTILALPGSFLFFLALNFAFNLSILTIILISILCTVLTALGFYFYPSSLIGGKSKKIKLELPFALVHMSAVAGSGAQPLSIFELIAGSNEYPELRKEIKKIMNYVNLFGYNLSTALRNVANTTASPELKELLFGMVSTVETGGDLKEYLKEKAADSLNVYRLDRKKQVEALATFSEIYTSLLIAAPLLLLVTLAIINSIGGKIGGFDVKILAWVGVAGALPLLNVGFMFFVTASQKGL